MEKNERRMVRKWEGKERLKKGGKGNERGRERERE